MKLYIPLTLVLIVPLLGMDTPPSSCTSSPAISPSASFTQPITLAYVIQWTAKLKPTLASRQELAEFYRDNNANLEAPARGHLKDVAKFTFGVDLK